MKSIATILLIYFTALFAIPCSDSNNGCDGEKTTSGESAHSHGQDSDDSCTPLCHCNCCSISLVAYSFKLPEFKRPFFTYSEAKVYATESSMFSSFFGAIWQPPKI